YSFNLCSWGEKAQVYRKFSNGGSRGFYLLITGKGVFDHFTHFLVMRSLPVDFVAGPADAELVVMFLGARRQPVEHRGFRYRLQHCVTLQAAWATFLIAAQLEAPNDLYKLPRRIGIAHIIAVLNLAAF